MTSHPLAPAAEIPPDTLRSFSVAGRRIFVANTQGEFRAADELCPHLAVPLSQGHIDNACLTCAGHGSVFRLVDGSVVKWMGRKPGFVSQLLSGKPTPLALLKVNVIEGIVHVDL
jgi:nitrite reductase/ring-hydroxylating ferredoxin subunit